MPAQESNILQWKHLSCVKTVNKSLLFYLSFDAVLRYGVIPLLVSLVKNRKKWEKTFWFQLYQIFNAYSRSLHLFHINTVVEKDSGQQLKLYSAEPDLPFSDHCLKKLFASKLWDSHPSSWYYFIILCLDKPITYICTWSHCSLWFSFVAMRWTISCCNLKGESGLN